MYERIAAAEIGLGGGWSCAVGHNTPVGTASLNRLAGPHNIQSLPFAAASSIARFTTSAGALVSRDDYWMPFPLRQATGFDKKRVDVVCRTLTIHCSRITRSSCHAR